MSGPVRGTGRSQVGSLLILLSVMLLAGAGVVYLAGPAGAASVTPTVIEGSSNTNKTCAVVMPGTTELKLEPANEGDPFPLSGNDGTLSVAIVKPSASAGSVNSFDWTSNIDVLGVIVKDGVDGANFYDYRPSGSIGDTYLTTPNAGDKGISHISFCYDPNQPEPAQLTIVKTAWPEDGSPAFSFVASSPLSPSNFSLTDPSDRERVFGALAAGTYTVEEALDQMPAGWEWYSVSCWNDDDEWMLEVNEAEVGEDATATVTLEAGDEVTCEFVNRKHSRITVDKVTDPPGDLTSFSFTPGGWNGGSSFDLADATDPKDTGWTVVPGDGFSVSESVPAGWTLTSAVCTSNLYGTVDEADFDLEAGEQVDCVFTNTKDPEPGYARITVDKVTDPAEDPTLFTFTPGGWNDGVVFQLADLTAKKDTGWTLTPGEGFSVSESVPTGWTLTSAICTSSLGGTVPAAGFDLAEGEQVNCVFTNTRIPERPDPGRIIVRKITLPDGAPPRSFVFDPSWGANFNLANGDSHDSGLLPAGVYSVSELMPLSGGWSLTSATCSDGSSPAAIGLSPRETVTCTFVNTFEEEVEGPKGSLTIIKVVEGVVNPNDAEAEFSFNGSLGGFFLADGGSFTESELESGAYTVAEGTLPTSANPPSDTEGGYRWHFDSVECTALNWDADGQSVTVNLAEGEAAVCTFYNYQETVAGPELPYTGSDQFMLPMLIGGLWALVLGLSMLVWSRMRRLDLS